ncbi:hypothetical protein LXA43DRAFT_1027905 [Ganoderma leucocontextum]|nr:hypothetical protein LXA43DRAFT_1027905 [Ganoderma leucocontextum]
MKNEALEGYINEYLYLSGVDSLLSFFFCLPIALSKLLSLSPSLGHMFDEEQPTDVVKPPPREARQFRATMAPEHLRQRFGEEGKKYRIDWEEVGRAFITEKNFGTGLEWNAEERVVSTAGPVTLHPEVALIQYLLDINDTDRPLDWYIACSSAPCYASVMYAGAVNDVLEKRHFTMRTDDPDWCQLSSAHPWILPKDTKPELVSRMKDELLRELAWMIDEWSRDAFSAGPAGIIAAEND